MRINTTESLKRKAAIIRTFFKTRYNLDVSQGHSLELVSKIFGFKDWNTATAILKPKMKSDSSSIQIHTVGELKKALTNLDDSASIGADYRFKVKELEEYEYNDPEDEMYQEFSFTIEKLAKDIVTLNLKLDHESGPPPNYDLDFIKQYVRPNED